MKIINKTTVIDDNTYIPVHTFTVVIEQTLLDDLELIKSLYGINDAAQIIGHGFLEQIFEGKKQ